jgi:hypothetical protein
VYYAEPWKQDKNKVLLLHTTDDANVTLTDSCLARELTIWSSHSTAPNWTVIMSPSLRAESRWTSFPLPQGEGAKEIFRSTWPE